MVKYLFFLLLCTTAYGYPKSFDTKVSQIIETIYRYPEGSKLIQEVEKEGRIFVYQQRFSSNSHAMWYGSQRSIVLNTLHPRSFGQMICSVVFEMHNALSAQKFFQLDHLAWRGKISKQEYVQKIEKIEHQNALKTVKFLEKAIASGYFPPSARWNICPDFKTHFSIQKNAGHSKQIAKHYDQLVRYRQDAYLSQKEPEDQRAYAGAWHIR